MTTGYIYENNIKYSNAGILPLLPKEIAFKIGERANQLMNDRPKKDIFTVFSQDLSTNHYSWIESIGEDELKQLKNLNISMIDSRKIEEVVDSKIRKHFLLKNTLFELNKMISLTKLFANFDSLITIEHANNEYKNFNYFNLLSGFLNGESELLDIAIKKIKDECRIKFDNRIFNSRYQNLMRQNNNLIDLPLTIESCVNPISRKYNRTYILLIEDVEIIDCTDETGDYIYIRLTNYSSMPKYFIEENGFRFCKVGVMPFLRPNDANILAQVLDSINSVKMNKLISKLTITNKIPIFEEDNSDSVETAAVISNSIFNSEEDWRESLSIEQIDRVERLTDIDLSEKNKHYAKSLWTANGMLYSLMTNANENIPNSNIRNLINKWDNIMIVEPIREMSINRYKKTHFGYFGGNIEDYEKTTIEASKRETLEEGCVVFDEKIYSDKYQNQIRMKNGLDSVPLFLNLIYNNRKTGHQGSYSTKVFLLFMEDIKITPKLDKKQNLYYEVSV